MEGTTDESLEGLILWQWDLESEEREDVSLRWRKFSESPSRIPYIALALSLVLLVPHHVSGPAQGSIAKSSVRLHGGQATTDITLCSHEQNKPFFFLSCLCQVFAYGYTKATNKRVFIFLEFLLDIQIRSWFWKGKNLHNRNCRIYVCAWVFMVKGKERAFVWNEKNVAEHVYACNQIHARSHKHKSSPGGNRHTWCRVQACFSSSQEPLSQVQWLDFTAWTSCCT